MAKEGLPQPSIPSQKTHMFYPGLVMVTTDSVKSNTKLETVCGQTLALWLGNGDEHCPLESDTPGLNVKGNFYL